jgi:hypothetical protein
MKIMRTTDPDGRSVCVFYYCSVIKTKGSRTGKAV